MAFSCIRPLLLALAFLLLVITSRAGDAAPARQNAIARLIERLDRGEVALASAAPRGYLDSLLAALDIDASSQVLVFSPTSLQAAYITSSKPRAIYFNDDTYVAWVQGSDTLEVVAVDRARGPVFFTVDNAPGRPATFEPQSSRCLACHGSAASWPAGMPVVLVRSSPVAPPMNPAGRVTPVEVSHATSLEDRWGGWYVTGRLGAQLHLGNQPLAGPPDPVVAAIHNRSNLDSLAEYFDTAPYLTSTSDIVALLVLEHQSYVHNLITRAHYRARGLLAASDAWDGLDRDRQTALREVLDPLVRALTFADEQRLYGRIRGSAGFEARFTARGPHDPPGRTLRSFDLTRRTFRYPISYLVYSAEFDALPAAMREYVYGQFVATLSPSTAEDALDADRHAALEILAATKPEFARHVGRHANPHARRSSDGAT